MNDIYFLILLRAVYFNPAKTIGGMMEADRYCLMGLGLAAFVSLGSMNMYWWFEVRHGWEWLADVLVILWIGLGMSFVAWMKLWMAKPTFNTGKQSYSQQTAYFTVIPDYLDYEP